MQNPVGMPSGTSLFLEATQLKTVRTAIAVMRVDANGIELQAVGIGLPKGRRPAEPGVTDGPQSPKTFIIPRIAVARGRDAGRTYPLASRRQRKLCKEKPSPRVPSGTSPRPGWWQLTRPGGSQFSTGRPTPFLRKFGPSPIPPRPLRGLVAQAARLCESRNCPAQNSASPFSSNSRLEKAPGRKTGQSTVTPPPHARCRECG